MNGWQALLKHTGAEKLQIRKPSMYVIFYENILSAPVPESVYFKQGPLSPRLGPRSFGKRKSGCPYMRIVPSNKSLYCF